MSLSITEPFDQTVEFTNSSALERAWYSTTDKSLVLKPRYDGKLYQYINVSKEQWEELKDAESPGKVWAKIRSYGGSVAIDNEPVVQMPPPDTFQITAKVYGEFVINSNAEDISQAYKESLDFLNEKLPEQLGLQYTIEKVERINETTDK